MKEKNLEYYVNLAGKEPEFFMKIGFESIEDILLSIAHRQLSNRGSGLIRHLGNPNGTRIVNGRSINGVYEENKKDARIFHDSYEEHIERLKLKEKGKDFVIISNGNLGNNPWHVAWQDEEESEVYCLNSEPFWNKFYTCFGVPKQGKPRIETVCFDLEGNIFNKLNKGISDEINWCISGQQIVRNQEIMPIEEIIDQFYDVKHGFDLRDWGDKERIERDMKIMREIYQDYPLGFRDKMLKKLREGFPRAKYYHSTLGVDDKGVVLYHYYDKIEEIAKRLVDRGVKDSIISDQGGSVGVYASWLDGYLSKSSYFRDNRISTIAFVLK